MADNISKRRINSNNFFLTLNSAILGFSVMFKNDKKILVSAIGILITLVWIQTISNYKRLIDIEKLTPIVFGAMYVGLLIYYILNK